MIYLRPDGGAIEFTHLRGLGASQRGCVAEKKLLGESG